jgi:hypothetical protein
VIAQEVNIEEKPLLRLVVMGKKSLPDPAMHSRPYWGYVELVTTKVEDIKDALKEGTVCGVLTAEQHACAQQSFNFFFAHIRCRGVQHGDAR